MRLGKTFVEELLEAEGACVPFDADKPERGIDGQEQSGQVGVEGEALGHDEIAADASYVADVRVCDSLEMGDEPPKQRSVVRRSSASSCIYLELFQRADELVDGDGGADLQSCGGGAAEADGAQLGDAGNVDKHSRIVVLVESGAGVSGDELEIAARAGIHPRSDHIFLHRRERILQSGGVDPELAIGRAASKVGQETMQHLAVI
jgi:hypothetical protein